MSLRNPEWLAKGAPAPMMCVWSHKIGLIMDCIFFHCAGCVFYPVMKRTNEAKKRLRAEEKIQDRPGRAT